MYAVIVTIGSEENSVAFYLKSETDSYYFSLAIWNSISPTQEYPSNYASAICRNVICCGEWQNHNYFYKYYLCKAGLSYYILLQRKQSINGLNAAPDMVIHLSSIKPNIKKLRWEEAKAQFTLGLTIHHIVTTKQGNSGTHGL